MTSVQGNNISIEPIKKKRTALENISNVSGQAPSFGTFESPFFKKYMWLKAAGGLKENNAENIKEVAKKSRYVGAIVKKSDSITSIYTRLSNRHSISMLLTNFSNF